MSGLDLRPEMCKNRGAPTLIWLGGMTGCAPEFSEEIKRLTFRGPSCGIFEH